MTTTTSRLLKLLSLLQTRRDWPGSLLAERLQTSDRTVRRDIDRLREMGYNIQATMGPDGGYRLGAGSELPPLLFDDDQTVAVAVALQSAAAAGVGIEEGAIRALVSARGLDDAVVLCGFQKNPWKYIARADVFALSSHYEGFGNVLVEAMACGVPVVATQSSGTRDIVRDGVDGVLVGRHEPGDLAAALARVLGDEPFRLRLANEARHGAERFALPLVASTYGRVFGSLLACA